MYDIKNYWDECYAAGRDFRFLSHQTVTRLLSYMDQDAEKTCLDIGCGTGQLTRELIHRGFRCTGIDISPIAISIASSLTVSSKAQYLCIDIEMDSMRPLSRQYSLITCKYVYAFIKDKHKFIKKIADHLAKDGVFCMVAPLVGDVSTDKRSIAVDFEQTMTELQSAFQMVETFSEHGATCFVGRFSNK